jgi:hypothetical protein
MATSGLCERGVKLRSGGKEDYDLRYQYHKEQK